MTTNENSTLNTGISVSAETDFNVSPNRVKFHSQSMQYATDSQKVILISRANFDTSQNQKLIRFDFKSDIQSGTYPIGTGNNPFSTIYYTEYSERSGLTQGIDYNAIDGSITITVNGDGRDVSYDITFKFTGQNQYDEKLVIDGSSKIYVSTYPR